MVIPIVSVKKGKPGKRVKTKESPGLEEIDKQVDEAVEILLEKYNQNHDQRGRFSVSTGGAAGGSATAPAAAGGRSSDLPPWMDAKPKPEAKPAAQPITQPAQASPTKPAYTPSRRLANGTYLPDSDGKYPYPDADHYRSDLKPLVGKEVKMEYWAENIGGKSLTNPDKKARCIKDVKVEGVRAPVHHVWAQEPSKELMEAKWGQKQEAIGVVTAYAKGKRGEPKKMDYSVQPVRNTINKEMPLLDADTLIKELGHLLEKYNHNHDMRGRFAPSTGGAGGATAQAGGVQSLDDALAGKPIEEQKPDVRLIPLEDAELVHVIEDRLGLPDEKLVEVAGTIDQIAGNAKLQEMHQVTFKELDTNVLAQCEGSWWTDGETGKLGWSETIAVNPRAKDYATSRYVEDHMKLLATNQMPWLASANAADAEKAYKAVLVHEVAHAKQMEHSLKSATGLANETNPMHGTKTWAKLVSEAHTEGWQGPSMYGRKNLGECFAESVSLLTIRGSTGNKKIDDYVVRVMQE